MCSRRKHTRCLLLPLIPESICTTGKKHGVRLSLPTGVGTREVKSEGSSERFVDDTGEHDVRVEMNPLVCLWSSRTKDDMPASPANQLIYPAVVNFVAFTDLKDIVHSSISPSMKLLPNQVVCRKSMAECSTPTLLSTCLCILES